MSKVFSLFAGKRTIKTAVAVFVTAIICEWLNWPPIFAVLSAIVSIEPTVNASIQKAKIRLPAAVLGAAFAMIFVWLLGDSPLSYALSVLFTIAVCHRLHWDDALVVAALTSFNMLVLTEDHFLLNFFTRVGTTSLGIFVSVAVNFFIFPPNFTHLIRKNYPSLHLATIKLIDDILTWHLERKGKEEHLRTQFMLLLNSLNKTVQFAKYQKEEFRYHRFKLDEYREVRFLRIRLEQLHKVLFLAGVMMNTELSNERISKQDRDILWGAWNELKKLFHLEAIQAIDRYYEFESASISQTPMDYNKLKDQIRSQKSEHTKIESFLSKKSELIALLHDEMAKDNPTVLESKSTIAHSLLAICPMVEHFNEMNTKVYQKVAEEVTT